MNSYQGGPPPQNYYPPQPGPQGPPQGYPQQGPPPGYAPAPGANQGFVPPSGYQHQPGPQGYPPPQQQQGGYAQPQPGQQQGGQGQGQQQGEPRQARSIEVGDRNHRPRDVPDHVRERYKEASRDFDQLGKFPGIVTFSRMDPDERTRDDQGNPTTKIVLSFGCETPMGPRSWIWSANPETSPSRFYAMLDALLGEGYRGQLKEWHLKARTAWITVGHGTGEYAEKVQINAIEALPLEQSPWANAGINQRGPGSQQQRPQGQPQGQPQGYGRTYGDQQQQPHYPPPPPQQPHGGPPMQGGYAPAPQQPQFAGPPGQPFAGQF